MLQTQPDHTATHENPRKYSQGNNVSGRPYFWEFYHTGYIGNRSYTCQYDKKDFADFFCGSSARKVKKHVTEKKNKTRRNNAKQKGEQIGTNPVKEKAIGRISVSAQIWGKEAKREAASKPETAEIMAQKHGVPQVAVISF